MFEIPRNVTFFDIIISVFAIINLYVIGKFYFQEKFSSL